MKVVYIIGKFRDTTDEKVRINIFKAAAVASELWKAGFAVICPHLNAGCNVGVSDEVILEGDFEFIRRSDFVFVLDNWRTSVGSVNEMTLCRELGIPMYEVMQDVIYYES